jgi:hypothetical protein
MVQWRFAVRAAGYPLAADTTVNAFSPNVRERVFSGALRAAVCGDDWLRS